MPCPPGQRLPANNKAIAKYSSPSGAGVSSLAVPSVLHDHEKYPYEGCFGSAMYIYVIAQFHSASNSAFLSSCTVIIMPYDIPSVRTSWLAQSVTYIRGPF